MIFFNITYYCTLLLLKVIVRETGDMTGPLGMNRTSNASAFSLCLVVLLIMLIFLNDNQYLQYVLLFFVGVHMQPNRAKIFKLSYTVTESDSLCSKVLIFPHLTIYTKTQTYSKNSILIDGTR